MVEELCGDGGIAANPGLPRSFFSQPWKKIATAAKKNCVEGLGSRLAVAGTDLASFPGHALSLTAWPGNEASTDYMYTVAKPVKLRSVIASFPVSTLLSCFSAHI